jgi:hypothetical protein
MRYLAHRHGLLAAIFAAGLSLSTSAPASTPSLLWSGAKQVSVHCLAQSKTVPDAAAFEKALCGRVRALAGRGARLPVKQIELGDPEFVSPGTIVLLVHASVERAANGRTIAFTIRPYSAARTDEIYFGTAPRVVTTRAAPAADGQLDGALRAALAEVLPWQQRTDPGDRRL